MDSTQTLVAVLGAVGAGAALLELVRGLVKWISGSAGRERIRNSSLRQERDAAWARAHRQERRGDREARNRNRLADYAAQLRRDCLDHGVPMAELRPWPQIDDPDAEELGDEY